MRNLQIFSLIALSLLLTGCPDKGPTDAERIAAFNTAGWESFESGSFSDALAEFGEAIALDSDSSASESYVGAGWSGLMLQDMANVADIITALEVATADAGWQTDAWAGIAIAYFSTASYPEADSVANLTLTVDNSYIFTHRPQVRWEDLHIIQGQSRFMLADYTGAWTAIMPILAGSTVYAQVDPADNTTWIVSGITYKRFEDIVALAINYLTEQFRG